MGSLALLRVALLPVLRAVAVMYVAVRCFALLCLAGGLIHLFIIHVRALDNGRGSKEVVHHRSLRTLTRAVQHCTFAG